MRCLLTYFRYAPRAPRDRLVSLVSPEQCDAVWLRPAATLSVLDRRADEVSEAQRFGNMTAIGETQERVVGRSRVGTVDLEHKGRVPVYGTSTA